MKKSFISLFLVVLFAVAMFVPAQALNTIEETRVYYTVLENGVSVETTVVVYSENSVCRGTQTKRASKSSVFKQGNTTVATVQLNGYFGYNGSTSWVISSNASKTVSPGWTYSGESIAHSGGTATLTATIKNQLTALFSVNISLSCSPSGAIS